MCPSWRLKGWVLTWSLPHLVAAGVPRLGLQRTPAVFSVWLLFIPAVGCLDSEEERPVKRARSSYDLVSEVTWHHFGRSHGPALL